MANFHNYHPGQIEVPSPPDPSWSHGSPFTLLVKVYEHIELQYKTNLHKCFSPNPLVYQVEYATHSYECEWDVIACVKSSSPAITERLITIYDISITYLARSPFQSKPGCLGLIAPFFMRSTGSIRRPPRDPRNPGSGSGSVGGTNDDLPPPTTTPTPTRPSSPTLDEIIRELVQLLREIEVDSAAGAIYSEIEEYIAMRVAQERGRSLLRRIQSAEVLSQVDPRISELVSRLAKTDPGTPKFGDRDLMKIADIILNAPS